MIKIICIAVVSFSFCSFLELKASGKEKPLLKVHESIKGGWVQFRTEHHFLEVTRSGRISLKKRTKVMLSAAELQALRNFLDSAPIKDLYDSYVDFELCSDCGGHSMEIEMTTLGKTKRIILKWSGPGPPRSKNYPVPLRDLVCKIYGIEKRVDGHKSFDSWCDAASLDLVPKPEP